MTNSNKLRQRSKTSGENEASKSSGNVENEQHNQLKSSPISKIDFKRIAIRCVLIIGIITFMSFTQRENFEVFASQKEEIKSKREFIECSSDYVQDVKKFPGCKPKKCGRMVTDYVISLAEVQALLIIAQKGLSLGGSAGGASILDLHSGALSQGNNFVNIYSIDQNHNAVSSEDLKIYSHIKNKIKKAVAENFELEENVLHLTHPTFFSRITADPAHTVHDEYWHPHVDKETYKSFHYTSLLYLTNYEQHFKGGRFVFIDSNSNKTVEPREGRLSAFTSGAENLHYVEKVTSGTRFAITVSFTCNPEYAIADPSFPVKKRS